MMAVIVISTIKGKKEICPNMVVNEEPLPIAESTGDTEELF